MKIVQNNENLSQNATGRKEKYFKNKNVKSTRMHKSFRRELERKQKRDIKEKSEPEREDEREKIRT
jgi:hypothetical protein